MNESLVTLFRGSPYLPRDPEPWDAGMRAALREQATLLRVREWQQTRLIFADRLSESGSPEECVARWPWRCGVKTTTLQWVTRWVVDGLPHALLPAAEALLNKVNAGGFMGWMPGELKLVDVLDVPPGADPAISGVRLVFSDFRGRSSRQQDHDVLAAPGGFPGLAWLSAKLQEDEG